jgi:hypothetical protein
MSRLNNSIAGLIGIIAATSVIGEAIGQCAGCGADYNKADRAATAREAERQRLDRVDPPIQKDPLGDAIISGGIAGLTTGSVVAGARAFITTTAMGLATEKAKEALRRR